MPHVPDNGLYPLPVRTSPKREVFLHHIAVHDCNGRRDCFRRRRIEAADLDEQLQAGIIEQDANRRREKQIRYNNLHGIVPRQAIKSGRVILSGDELRHGSARYDLPGAKTGCAADPVAAYMTDRDIESAIKIARAAMESAARELDFTAAAAYRDQMYALQEKQKSMQKK